MTTPDVAPTTDRLALAAGVFVLVATVVTLVATPPPPQYYASAHTWSVYLVSHRDGLVVNGVATALGAVALVVLAARLAAARAQVAAAALLIGTATLAASALVVGGLVQSQLADMAARLDDSGVLALLGVSRALLYVAPAYGMAALASAAVATAPRGAAAWWRWLSWGIAAVTLVAAVVTTAGSSASAAGLGFAARLLFTLWVVVTGWQASRTGRAAAQSPSSLTFESSLR